MQERIANRVPTYFCRYEDLLKGSTEILTEIMSFILNVDSLEGTVCEARIKQFTSKDKSHQRASVYKLKSDVSDFKRNNHRYNAAQMEHMRQGLKEFNFFYGYCNDPSGVENPTEVFAYTEEERAQIKSSFMGFKEHNKQVL